MPLELDAVSHDFEHGEALDALPGPDHPPTEHRDGWRTARSRLVRTYRSLHRGQTFARSAAGWNIDE